MLTCIIGTKIYDTKEATLGDVLTSAFRGSNRSLFASFVSFLDEETTKKAITGVPAKGFALDSNFVSNFKQDVLSTSFHAAPVVWSYSLQYLGTKMWIFISPKDHEKYTAISHPATIPLSGTEQEYFSSRKVIN